MMKLHVITRFFFCWILVLATAGCVSPSVPKVAPEELPSYLETMGVEPTSTIIMVDSKNQTLTLLKDNKVQKTYTISTGKKGLGQRANTFKTHKGYIASMKK